MNAETRYLAADRRNVFSWYSRGLVLPPTLMTKYRDDALAAAPAFLTLTTAEASVRLAPAAHDPVVVELSTRLSWSGASTSAPQVRVAGAFSVRHLIRVHVRTEDEAGELAARQYQGFDAARLPIEVTPQLFAESADAADLDETTAATDVPTTSGEQGVHAGSLLQREAVGGGLLAAASSPLTRETLAMAEHGRDPFAALVEGMDRSGWLADDADRTLLSRALAAIHLETLHGDLVPSAVVDRLMEDSVETGLDRYLRRILQLVRGEAELRPFKAGGPNTAKALLLFLLRPDPVGVASWEQDDIGAEPKTIAVAKVLAGLASRYGGLPEALRDEALDGAVLDWVAAGVEPNDFVVAPVPPCDDTSPDDASVADPTASAGLGAEPVSDNAEPAPTAGDGSAPEQALPLRSELEQEVAEGDQSRAVALAQTMGWADCLVLRVTADSVEARSQGRRILASFPVGAVVEWALSADRFAERLIELDDQALVTALAGRKPRRRPTRKRVQSEADLG